MHNNGSTTLPPGVTCCVHTHTDRRPVLREYRTSAGYSSLTSGEEEEGEDSGVLSSVTAEKESDLVHRVSNASSVSNLNFEIGEVRL